MAQTNERVPDKLDFLTPTVMSVFSLFLDDPMHEYYEREVLRETGVSKGSANKILRLLSKLGLLSRETKGRMAFYRLNSDEATAKQFKILRSTFAMRNLVRSLKPHSRKIVLFGSTSQGTDTGESDIDLFVLASEKELVLEEISVFNRGAERRVVPIVADNNEFIKLKRDNRALYDNIERGIVLWRAE